jgi:RimJ/RimL family protein N-acetyltransferase
MALGGVIRGKRTTLRTPVEDDLAAINRWMADMRVRHRSRIWHEPAMPATWKERLTEQTKDQNGVLWSIDADAKLVGFLRIAFGWDNRQRAWIEQLVIEPDEWRKGLGTDAALALHRYLFDYLDLQRISVTLREDNIAARKIAEKLGYQQFARGSQVHYRDGGYVDELWLFMERPAWDERYASEREYEPLGAAVARGGG